MQRLCLCLDIILSVQGSLVKGLCIGVGRLCIGQGLLCRFLLGYVGLFCILQSGDLCLYGLQIRLCIGQSLLCLRYGCFIWQTGLRIDLPWAASDC